MRHEAAADRGARRSCRTSTPERGSSSGAEPSAPTLNGVPARVTVPLVAGVLCLLGLVVTAVLALHVPAVHERDAALFHGFFGLGRTRLREPLMFVSELGDPVPYGMAGLVLVGIALHRGMTERAIAVAAVLILTGVATQLAKIAFATPRYDAWLELTDGQIGSEAFPSGHATAAMTLALCAVLVVPPAARAITALVGWGFAVAMGYALPVLTWHYPSDVLGGLFMAGLWTSLAVAGLYAVEPRPADGRPWRSDGVAALVVAGGAVLAALVVLEGNANAVTRYPSERLTLFLGAFCFAALAGALTAAFARVA